jgi:hypothetical protein
MNDEIHDQIELAQRSCVRCGRPATPGSLYCAETILLHEAELVVAEGREVVAEANATQEQLVEWIHQYGHWRNIPRRDRRALERREAAWLHRSTAWQQRADAIRGAS